MKSKSPDYLALKETDSKWVIVAGWYCGKVRFYVNIKMFTKSDLSMFCVIQEDGFYTNKLQVPCFDAVHHLLISFLERYSLCLTRNQAALIDALLKLSRLTRAELNMQQRNLSDLATELVEEIQSAEPDIHVKFVIQKHLTASFDASLLRVALLNLLNNAIKFSRAKANPLVEFGSFSGPHNAQVFYIRDNGVGFDMQYANRLFGAFQRLHSHNEFEGMGIGLATVARIIHRHHGEIWAEAEVDKGATFYFTLNDANDDQNSHFYPYQKAG